jgi:Lrp/AsnC family transcriptional regulator
MKQSHQIDKIDKIDRLILLALQADASVSHAALAEMVGASTASCWRRIKALEAAGIVKEMVRLVDAAKVNLGVNVFCNVRIRSHAPEHRQAFEAFVHARGEIMECYSMSGEWDYQLRIIVADVADYERFLMRTLLGENSVLTAASHFALNQVKHTTAVPV